MFGHVPPLSEKRTAVRGAVRRWGRSEKGGSRRRGEETLLRSAGGDAEKRGEEKAYKHFLSFLDQITKIASNVYT